MCNYNVKHFHAVKSKSRHFSHLENTASGNHVYSFSIDIRKHILHIFHDVFFPSERWLTKTLAPPSKSCTRFMMVAAGSPASCSDTISKINAKTSANFPSLRATLCFAAAVCSPWSTDAGSRMCLLHRRHKAESPKTTKCR